jgi:hypothetical protein
MTIVTPPPAIQRDRYGRPMVIGPNGGKPVAYTRCTTYIDVLEDKYNLQKWMQRMVALGLSSRPDLLLSVSAHADDKRQLDKICEDAREAAAASAAATTGTALHALTELVDRGQELPVLPDSAKADLEAYRAATADLKATHIEQFCVLDPLQIGGTPDRVVSYKGQRYIADIKTGSIEYGVLKIAMQLAIYARSHTYDIATGERGSHDADLTKGLVIHLPAGEARCELHWVDLIEGWNAVTVARQVREKRKLKFTDLATPFAGLEAAVPVTDALVDRIRACATADAVRALWAENASVWTDDLSEVARAHIASLPSAS